MVYRYIVLSRRAACWLSADLSQEISVSCFKLLWILENEKAIVLLCQDLLREIFCSFWIWNMPSLGRCFSLSLYPTPDVLSSTWKVRRNCTQRQDIWPGGQHTPLNILSWVAGCMISSKISTRLLTPVSLVSLKSSLIIQAYDLLTLHQLIVSFYKWD